MHRYGITEDKYLGRKSLVALMITGLLTVGGSVPMVLAETGEEAPVETTVEGESQAETEVLAEATPQADIAESGITTEVKDDTLYVRGSGELKSVDIPRYTDWTIHKIVIGNGITSIADTDRGVFYKLANKNVESITLPNSLTYIGNKAFSGMKKVPSITIPDNVTALGESAFSGCENATTLSIGSGLQTIGKSAFSGCDQLTSIDLRNVTSIGEGAFSHLDNLQSANMPNVITIGATAFRGCGALVEVDIPSCKTLGTQVFSFCDKLATVSGPMVTSIGEECFSSSGSLTSVDFPNATSIGTKAFYSCKALTTASFPNVKQIREGAFYYCENLSNVTVDNAEIIESNAFYGCDALKSLVFNNAIETKLGAFTDNKSLESIEFKGDAPAGQYIVPANAKTIFPADNATWTEEARARITMSPNNMYMRNADGTLTKASYITSAEKQALTLGKWSTTGYPVKSSKTFTFSIAKKGKVELDFNYSYSSKHTSLFGVTLKNSSGDTVYERSFNNINSKPNTNYSATVDLEAGNYYLETTCLPAYPTALMSVCVTEVANKPVDMIRLYNPNSGEHFYTASSAESRSLVRAGWKYEGKGWTAPTHSNTPVYRLYSGTDHHYTTSKAERDALVKSGWKYEGIGWYSDDAKGVPLYRQFNPNVNPKAAKGNSGSHNYTTSLAEHNGLVKAGWKGEGVAWYGMK